MSVGIGLAVFTVRRTLLMETELQQRYEEGLRARQELQELSARLYRARRKNAAAFRANCTTRWGNPSRPF